MCRSRLAHTGEDEVILLILELNNRGKIIWQKCIHEHAEKAEAPNQ